MAKGQIKESMQAQIVELQRKVWLHNAQDIGAYTKAQHELHTLAKRDFTASGVVIQIQSLSGAFLLSPVMIHNGLGGSSLEQLSREIRESHDARLCANPLAPAWQWKGV